MKKPAWAVCAMFIAAIFWLALCGGYAASPDIYYPPVSTYEDIDVYEDEEIKVEDISAEEINEADTAAESEERPGLLRRMWLRFEETRFWQWFVDTSIGFDFYRTFVRQNRYRFFVEGMRNTLLLSVMALTLGTAIGLFVTFLSLSKWRITRYIAKIYLDIIRGTPLMVQLMIWYFVVFLGTGVSSLVAGAVAFGVNSAAYVSEIFRAGIMSIDKGQTEAGRSLGLTSFQTMRLIILPQAIKNVLPALANEYIVLIKETAIVFVIGVRDIMRAANTVINVTFAPIWPLFGALIMYYIIVKVLSIFFRWLERRMRRSDAR